LNHEAETHPLPRACFERNLPCGHHLSQCTGRRKTNRPKYLDPKLLNGLKITNVENLIIAKPLAEYSGGILVTGKFLSTARLSIWRYLLMDGTNAVGEMA